MGEINMKYAVSAESRAVSLEPFSFLYSLSRYYVLVTERGDLPAQHPSRSSEMVLSLLSSVLEN